MIKLYDFERSGNCHKVRMMLSMLDLEYERINVDLGAKQQLQSAFLEINPLHKVPVINDDGLLLRDSSAILLYLAEKYGDETWYPADPVGRAEVQQWLSLAGGEIFSSCALARAVLVFDRVGDLTSLQAVAWTVIAVLEDRLANSDWLATGQRSIADLACYPYIGLIHEGQIDLAPYPAVRAWLGRVEALPGYVSMPGLPFSK